MSTAAWYRARGNSVTQLRPDLQLAGGISLPTADTGQGLNFRAQQSRWGLDSERLNAVTPSMPGRPLWSWSAGRRASR